MRSLQAVRLIASRRFMTRSRRGAYSLRSSDAGGSAGNPAESKRRRGLRGTAAAAAGTVRAINSSRGSSANRAMARLRLAAGTYGIDDADEFSCDMTDGHAVMFVHLLFVVVVNFTKAGLM